MKERSEFSKKIKSNKGSITSFTLLSMLFFLIVLIAIYSTVNTKVQKQEKELKAIKDSYKQENIDDIYENTLNGKAGLLATYVKVGDYVSYEPDALNESALNTLKTNLSTYSGKSDSTINSAIKREDLKWRVLDVNKKTGEVRLISAEPTNSKIELSGYNGYNNAVKLIDDACNTLYNNSKFASKVQNLKIEDVTRHMTTQPVKNNTEYKYTNINYPTILKQEKNQIVDESTTNKIALSEQKEFVTERSLSSTSILKNTYWSQNMNKDTSFKERIYYELFIKKDENYYSTYWISSRCIVAGSGYAHFRVHFVGSGYVDAYALYHLNSDEYSGSYALYPIITLKANVKINESNPGEGIENNAYKIKIEYS